MCDAMRVCARFWARLAGAGHLCVCIRVKLESGQAMAYVRHGEASLLGSCRIAEESVTLAAEEHEEARDQLGDRFSRTSLLLTNGRRPGLQERTCA